MKTVLLILLFIATPPNNLVNQETETVKASFTEFDDDVYLFKDKDGFSVEFEHVKDEILKQYDLKGDSLKGKLFLITYFGETEVDADGEDIITNTIIALKLLE